ncbi:MAG: type II toxin-antitoxin system HicA family toxin [Methanomicrobiales archaeon HGW-Methanomicrobiales-5]|nr:MAG: type II toxin-antitoxin system HicA family toxin [Methanomicrobiales archaeon HGW-Methanomicrobiales-5]
MATRDNKKVLKALTKKGFKLHNSNHIKLTLHHNGKKTGLTTWVSHGKQDLGDRMIGIMADQLQLERGEFQDLVDCHISASGLIQLYHEKGVVI